MATIAPEIIDTMYELAMKVDSKSDFEDFVERLVEDYEVNRDVWENRSVPEFLTSLADCSRRAGQAEAFSNPSHEESEHASWQRMARLLLGATVVR
jgi:hypothetical protein